jgi:hypothetical protein
MSLLLAPVPNPHARQTWMAQKLGTGCDKLQSIPQGGPTRSATPAASSTKSQIAECDMTTAPCPPDVTVVMDPALASALASARHLSFFGRASRAR